MGKYFTVGELCESSTAKTKGIKNIPDEMEVSRLEKLIEKILDPLREAYGKPIYVNSGYRCAALNKAVGGVPTSNHVYGFAADITSQNKSDNKILFELIKKLKLPFTELIWEKGNDFYPDWIHVSYNPEKIIYKIVRL